MRYVGKQAGTSRRAGSPYMGMPLQKYAHLNGIDAYIDLSGIASVLYTTTLPAVHHIALVKLPAQLDEQLLVNLTPSAGTYPRQGLRASASASALRTVQQNVSGTVVMNANGTDACEDGVWRLLQWAIWLEAGVFRAYFQVDGEAREGPDASTFAPITWTPEALTLGAALAGGVPTAFCRADLAYYAVHTGEQWAASKWMSIWDAFNSEGGRQDLQVVTDKIKSELTLTTRLRWAGPLDGSDGHVPAYTTPTYQGDVKFRRVSGFATVAPSSTTLTGYMLGNSLSRGAGGWETEGGANLDALDEVATNNRAPLDYGWHLQCGESLKTIHTAPAADPACFATSPRGLWPTALAGESFNWISVQPHPGTGSTLSTDLAAIQAFAALQPTARILLMQTPPERDNLLSHMGPTPPALSDPTDPDTVRGIQAYYDLLYDALDELYGPRVSLIPIAQATYLMGLACDAGDVVGLSSHTDLYRDTSHATHAGAWLYMLCMANVIAGRPLTGANSWTGTATSVQVRYAAYCARQACLADPRCRVRG